MGGRERSQSSLIKTPGVSNGSETKNTAPWGAGEGRPSVPEMSDTGVAGYQQPSPSRELSGQKH